MKGRGKVVPISPAFGNVLAAFDGQLVQKSQDGGTYLFSFPSVQQAKDFESYLSGKVRGIGRSRKQVLITLDRG
jgi:hypothetical protein